jgi:hypothetical protein
MIRRSKREGLRKCYHNKIEMSISKSRGSIYFSGDIEEFQKWDKISGAGHPLTVFFWGEELQARKGAAPAVERRLKR